jgi:hypothetical protein
MRVEALFVLVTSGLLGLTFAIGMLHLMRSGVYLSTDAAVVSLGASVVSTIEYVGSNQTEATIWLPSKITGYAYALRSTQDGFNISVEDPAGVSIDFRTNYPVEFAVKGYGDYVRVVYSNGTVWVNARQ